MKTDIAASSGPTMSTLFKELDAGTVNSKGLPERPLKNKHSSLRLSKPNNVIAKLTPRSSAMIRTCRWEILGRQSLALRPFVVQQKLLSRCKDLRQDRQLSSQNFTAGVPSSVQHMVSDCSLSYLLKAERRKTVGGPILVKSSSSRVLGSKAAAVPRQKGPQRVQDCKLQKPAVRIAAPNRAASRLASIQSCVNASMEMISRFRRF